MRKKKRTTRPTSAIMNPGELDSIFLITHVHLSLLLNGQADADHLQTLAGMLNLGFGLAAVRNKPQLAQEVQAAMEVMFEIARSTPPALPAKHKDAFLAVLRKIESTARMSSRSSFLAAVKYEKEAIKAGKVSVQEFL